MMDTGITVLLMPFILKVFEDVIVFLPLKFWRRDVFLLSIYKQNANGLIVLRSFVLQPIILTSYVK